MRKPTYALADRTSFAARAPRERVGAKKAWKKVLLVIGFILAAILGFMSWYDVRYSMAVARSFEVEAAPGAPKVLIATQGSVFKDSVVAGVVDHLKQRSVSAKVIDVSALAGVKESDWNAIVVIHTWQMRKPPAAVKAFVDRTPDRSRLVVLTTSGAGDFKLAGVDAISSASKMIDVPARVAEISGRVDAILAKQAAH